MSTETFESFQYSLFSSKLFLREIVEKVCGLPSRWGIEGRDDKPFVAPHIPPHYVDHSVTSIQTYQHCLEIVSQRYYSMKQGEFYGLVPQIDDEINRRLKEFGWWNWWPLKYHLEGNVMGFPGKYSILQSYANDERVETICEIGFNAGYSALFMALHNPRAKFFAFDVFYHNYSALALSTLQEFFPERDFLGIGGDSSASVPRFHRLFPDIKCNLLFIDGGHSTESLRKDIENMASLANRSYHRVLVDDTHIGNNLYDEYNKFRTIYMEEDETRSMYKDMIKNGAFTFDPSDDGVVRHARVRHIHQYFVNATISPCFTWELRVTEDLSFVSFQEGDQCTAHFDQASIPYKADTPSGISVGEYLFE